MIDTRIVYGLMTAFLMAFAVGVFAGPKIIAFLKSRKMDQKISEDVPEHMAKASTPAMGGLIFLIAAAVGSVALLFLRGDSAPAWTQLWGVLVLTAAYALLGFVDDLLTIRPVGKMRGISSKPKAALQMLFAALFVWWNYSMFGGPQLVICGKVILAGIWYHIFCVLFIAGMANFVNLTDGLDGLAGGLGIISLTAIVIAELLSFDMFMNAPIFFFAAALAGGIAAFLWYNAYPAKVFMGDVGSLAIGVFLPAYGVVAHREVFIVIAGMMFILEGLSTTVQWAVFKYTRIRTGTGRRVFKKSPVHHHFQLSGISETAISVRFWILGIVCACVALGLVLTGRI